MRLTQAILKLVEMRERLKCFERVHVERTSGPQVTECYLGSENQSLWRAGHVRQEMHTKFSCGNLSNAVKQNTENKFVE